MSTTKTTYRIFNTTTAIPGRLSTAVFTRKGEFYQVQPEERYFESRDAWIANWQNEFAKWNKENGEGTFAMQVREYVTGDNLQDTYREELREGKVHCIAAGTNPKLFAPTSVTAASSVSAPQVKMQIISQFNESNTKWIPTPPPPPPTPTPTSSSLQRDLLEDALMGLSKDELLRLVLNLRNDSKVSTTIHQITTTTTTTTTTTNTNNNPVTPMKEKVKPMTPPAPKKEAKSESLSKLKWDYKEKSRDTLPAGTYYIGDLCYALQTDLYDNVYGPDYEDGLYTSSAGSFCMFGTGGDGEFKSNHNYAYPVDAGHIGIASIALCNPIKDIYGGKVFTFTEPVDFQFTNEAFRFYSGGQYLRISNYADYNTDDEDDYDDDYE